MADELRTSTITEEPKAETAIVEKPSTTPQTIVADQPKEESSFRRWNQETGEVETLSTKLEEEPAKEQAAPNTEEQPKVEEKKEPEPLLAGKYKTPQELEKAYKELEREFHSKRQEESKTQKEEIKEAAKPVVQEAKIDYATLLLEDPTGKKFEDTIFQRIDQRMMTHAQTQKIQADWDAANPDLVNMKEYVGVEVREILASHPEKAGTDVQTLLQEATGNLRAKLNPLVTQAKQEALTVRTTVQPLGVTGQARKEEKQTSAEQSVSSVDPVAEEIARRKAQYARVAGRPTSR